MRKTASARKINFPFFSVNLPRSSTHVFRENLQPERKDERRETRDGEKDEDTTGLPTWKPY